MRKINSFILLCLFTTMALNAQTFFVRNSGSNFNDGSELNPWATLKHAVENAPENSVIDILGVFTEGGIAIYKKNLTILGGGISNTVVQAAADSYTNAESAVFLIDSCNVVLKNFTIQHGNALTGSGGIHVNNGETLFERLHITKNFSGNGGAGVWYAMGKHQITECIIDYNTANGRGGGLRIHANSDEEVDVTIDRTLISHNVNTNNQGGGVNLQAESLEAKVTFRNSTIAFNSAEGGNGGGINVQNANVNLILLNTTVAYNVGRSSAGVYLRNDGMMKITMVNSLLTGNTLPGTGNPADYQMFINATQVDSIYNCVIFAAAGFDVTQDTANLILGTNASPELVKLDTELRDNGGFTKTLAIADGSVCINAGNPNYINLVDQRGVARQGIPDIGAFEFADPGTGIPASLKFGNIGIYPNPATNIIFLDREDISRVRIFDMTGKLVLDEIINEKSIDISGLEKGMYLLRCSSLDRKEYSSKIVIK